MAVPGTVQLASTMQTTIPLALLMAILPSPTCMVARAVAQEEMPAEGPVAVRISLEADGNGTLTIQSGATISANGGGVASTDVNGGGGGSGGSIRLAGKSITNNGSITGEGRNTTKYHLYL